MKLVIIAFLFALPNSCDAYGFGIECPDNFVVIHKGCYYISRNQNNFFDAVMQCEQLGSSLVSIETLEESYALNIYLHHLNKKAIALYWTSGSDAFREGSFIWMPNMQRFYYTDWCRSQPDNSVGPLGDEDCVVLRYDRSEGFNWCWNDMSCHVDNLNNNPIYYICERKPL